MHIPKNLLYTTEHAWIKVHNDIVTIGITDDLQDILESIEAVDLPRKGDELYIGDNCTTRFTIQEDYTIYHAHLQAE